LVLSKRERLVAIATLAAVGLLALDQVVLSPLMAASDELKMQIARAREDLDKAQSLFKGRQRRTPLWADMQNKGLRRKDASQAESQLLNSIREWAQDSGMTLLSAKPDRTDKEKDFQRSTFRVTGSGGMGQIGRFLWHAQTAEMPVRIVDLQLTTRKEGTDDLSLQVGISTIYLVPESDKEASAESPGAARPREVAS
jgi:hypothetical protein